MDPQHWLKIIQNKKFKLAFFTNEQSDQGPDDYKKCEEVKLKNLQFKVRPVFSISRKRKKRKLTLYFVTLLHAVVKL